MDNWEYDAILIPDFERYYIKRKHWNWIYAARNNVMALVSSEHPLADRTELKESEIIKQPLITVSVGIVDDHYMADLKERFSRYNESPQVIYTYKNAYKLKYLLRLKDAMLLADDYLDYSDDIGNIQKIPIRDSYNGIICAWNPSNRNPALSNFLRLLPVIDVAVYPSNTSNQSGGD